MQKNQTNQNPTTKPHPLIWENNVILKCSFKFLLRSLHWSSCLNMLPQRKIPQMLPCCSCSA